MNKLEDMTLLLDKSHAVLELCTISISIMVQPLIFLFNFNTISNFLKIQQIYQLTFIFFLQYIACNSYNNFHKSNSSLNIELIMFGYLQLIFTLYLLVVPTFLNTVIVSSSLSSQPITQNLNNQNANFQNALHPVNAGGSHILEKNTVQQNIDKNAVVSNLIASNPSLLQALKELETPNSPRSSFFSPQFITAPVWEQSVIEIIYNAYARGNPNIIYQKLEQYKKGQSLAKLKLSSRDNGLSKNQGNDNYYTAGNSQIASPTYASPIYTSVTTPVYYPLINPSSSSLSKPSSDSVTQSTNNQRDISQKSTLSSQTEKINKRITQNVINNIMGQLVGKKGQVQKINYNNSGNFEKSNINVNIISTITDSEKKAVTTQIPNKEVESRPTNASKSIEVLQGLNPSQLTSQNKLVANKNQPLANNTNLSLKVNNTKKAEKIQKQKVLALYQQFVKVEPSKLKYIDYLNRFKPSSLLGTTNEVMTYREGIFRDNIAKIQTHNGLENKTYRRGINLFTDIAQHQFITQKLKLKIPQIVLVQALLQEFKLIRAQNELTFTQPEKIVIDWSCKASNVISQGACGASYIISALQSIQITAKIYNKGNLSLSIQQLLSCNIKLSSMCLDGYYEDVFNYARENGVGDALLYPYDDLAKRQNKVSDCNTNLIQSSKYMKNKLFIKESRRIQFADCRQMVNILKERSLVVGITAEKLQFYMDGTFQASSNDVNHAVTLVGYYPQKGYLIKNSWDKSWGINGYAYLSESTRLCNFAMYSILKDEDPKTKQNYCKPSNI